MGSKCITFLPKHKLSLKRKKKHRIKKINKNENLKINLNDMMFYYS